MRRATWVTLLGALLCSLAPALANAESTWTENSFEGFRDGTFLDAGSNLYVSAAGRIQIINRWDLNGDGHLDLVLPAGHRHSEKENTYVYFNRQGDMNGRNRQMLPGNGSSDGCVADFNQDGLADLAVANFADSHYKDVDAWVFFGAPEGFNARRRAALPAAKGKAIAAGDFNGDSWVDLAIACSWQAGTIEAPEGPPMSFVYWNSPEGFLPESRLPLVFDGQGADDVAAADLDGDGRDDLVVLANRATYVLLSSRQAFRDQADWIRVPLAGSALALARRPNQAHDWLAVCAAGSVTLVPGNQGIFRMSDAQRLPVDSPSDVALADVDGNGSDDVVVANYATTGGATWTDSLVFYSDAEGSWRDKPLRLPTLGASGVSAGDLNGDGLPELVFSNRNVVNQRSVLSYIFWNREGKFHFGDHSQLATEGTVANTIADVDNDGLPDVVFFNEEGGLRDGPGTTYIYWGDGTRNYSSRRRTGFPTHHLFGYGHADLDDDGHVDLILSQARYMKGVEHEQNGLILYWGGAEGLTGPSNLSMHHAYGGVHIADLNRDGYLDIVAGGTSVDLDDPKQHGFPIFWGSAQGLQHRQRTVLHYVGEKMRAPLVMDFNRDGWLDIAGQVEDGKIKFWWGSERLYSDENVSEIDLGRDDHLMYLKGADLNQDGWLDLLLPKRGPADGALRSSLIYYGSAQGFSNERRSQIPSYVAYENSIADFNKDGWLDIFLTSYGGEVNGNRPSLLYWGGPEGFQGRPPSELPTYGASGSEAADFDGDGWLDIWISNHRRSGSTNEPKAHRHATESMLYWGGPDGFSPNRRWEVPSDGPSGLNLRDVGNSYDRGLYEDYISSSHAIPDGEQPSSIAWTADTPGGTDVHVQVGVADHEADLEDAPWLGADGPGSWFKSSPARLEKLQGRWIRYRARLITPNGGRTPYLKGVTIRFDD